MQLIEEAIYEGFESVGNAGVNKLIDEESDSDTTGRLRDSFTFSTIKHPPQPRGMAEPGDAVPQVTEKLTMVIGTRTPYAVAVNFGYGSMEAGPYVLGAPGNANTYDELVSQILEWMRNKGIRAEGTDGPGGGGGELSMAHNIANNILEKGTFEHQFWQQSVDFIKDNALKIVRAKVAEKLKRYKNPDQYANKVDLTFKL